MLSKLEPSVSSVVSRRCALFIFLAYIYIPLPLIDISHNVKLLVHIGRAVTLTVESVLATGDTDRQARLLSLSDLSRSTVPHMGTASMVSGSVAQRRVTSHARHNNTGQNGSITMPIQTPSAPDGQSRHPALRPSFAPAPYCAASTRSHLGSLPDRYACSRPSAAAARRAGAPS